MKTPAAELPVLLFKQPRDWARWLDAHHAGGMGVWLQIAKKDAGLRSVTYPEALELALCYGWIDGQKKSHDASSWLQKFTPRGAKSIWSQINRGKALALMDSGQMKPAGLREVERAREDGRWDAAYEPQRTAGMPEDLAAALQATPRAGAFFAELDSRNRYAVLFRLQTAKKSETRARRLAQFVDMLARQEKFYP
ncbi:YdeI/OmpD-associated family protein [Polaromonas sp.]|uniref:YdeI/OmpD-associated family protein n=1 Tax=Polaromonas sp. TaxID=1869339 RepID=UPI002FC88B4D